MDGILLLDVMGIGGYGQLRPSSILMADLVLVWFALDNRDLSGGVGGEWT